MPISLIRSVVMLYLFVTNKLLGLHFNNLMIFCLTIIIVLFINKYAIYDLSFIFSFVAIFVILFTPNKKYIYIYVQIATLPIVLNNFHKYNLTSFIAHLIVSFYFINFFFPMQLILLLLPWKKLVYYNGLGLLELLQVFNKISYHFITHSLNTVTLIIYYSLCYLLIVTKKMSYLFLIIVLLITHDISYFIQNTVKVSFIDVGQGDAILIHDLKYNLTILIDSGGSFKKEVNEYLVDNKIVPFLYSQNIKEIDYYISSHGDYDHIGTLSYLRTKIVVKEVVINCNEINELEREHTIFLKENLYLQTNNLKASFNCKSNLNENDSSIISLFEIFDYTFLSMGDLSAKYEPELHANFLKLSHHGSKTSTSDYLLSNKLKAVFISSGSNNYGHPHEDVLTKVRKYPVYKTEIHGNIQIVFKKSSYKIVFDV